MHVFIMWAGDRSHSLARQLKGFLQFVVRGPKYFISDDIEGGRLWRMALSSELEAASFGVACMTHDNLLSHWLHFEAGALSKAVGQAHVIPYLVGPKTTDVEGPLADFQMLLADEAGTQKLVSLLASQVEGTELQVVNKSFKLVWPEFAEEIKVTKTEAATTSDEPLRSDRAVLQEVLDRVRRLESRIEPASPPAAKVLERRIVSFDPDILLAMKARVNALLDEIEPHTTQTSMDEAISRWRQALMKASASAEEIADIYREAKSLRDYLER